MGEKKKKEAETARWKKVVVVVACVLFVVLMIVSGMGYGWLGMFSSVKSGQAVQIAFTLYDGAGNPVLTTDEQVFASAVKSGKTLLGAQQITLIANQSLPIDYYPVKAYLPANNGVTDFGLTANEFNAISSAVVGMKANEQKSVLLPPTAELEEFMDNKKLEGFGIDVRNVSSGDIMGMTVYGYTVPSPAKNTTPNAYLRLGEITRKTGTGVVVDGNYVRADIRVIAFGTSN